MLKRKLKRSLRRAAMLLAAAGMVTGGYAGSAHAFSYSTGDLIGVVVANSTEMIVNLTSSPSSATFTMPSQFNGSITSDAAAKFVALGVLDNNAQDPSILYSAGSSIDPTPPDQLSAFTFGGDVTAAGNALDVPPSQGFLSFLANFPPTGTGIVSNTANELVIASSNSSGYESSLDSLGNDEINNSMPFSVALGFGGGTTASGNLWQSQADATNAFNVFVNLQGTISAHDNGDGTMTFAFATVPEPGTLLLLGSGLMGLLVVGRPKKTA